MATTTVDPRTPAPRRRRWGFGVAALAWYIACTVGLLDPPQFAVVVVLGLLVMLSVEPDLRAPTRGVVPTGRNLVLALLAALAFVPVALGMDLLRGRIPLETGHAVLATLAALCAVLPRLAQTRELGRRAVLGHRELIIAVTGLVAATRMYQAGEVFVGVVAFAVLAPVVMLVRRVRLGGASPGRLAHRRWAWQAGNWWLFLALLAAAGLSGMLFIWRIYAAGAYSFFVGAFWVGLAATAVLAAFPRRRVSVAANLLVALGSIFLVVQLVTMTSPPRHAVALGNPLAEPWDVASGGRSELVNNHWPLTMQRHAIDAVQLVDGRTHGGDRSRLENFSMFGDPVLAVADGRAAAAVDGIPDEPVGGRTWHAMEGNHVVLDIGGGHYVLYGHLKRGSLRVRVGDDVRRGQVIGQVGDSGNSDEPHLHIQVQNTPTADVEDREIRTSPMLFDGTTVADPRRGDAVRPG